MGTPTANFGWTKPTIGGDSNSWGSELNSDLDSIDSTVFAIQGTANAALPKSGGTLTGALNEMSGSDIASAATVNLTNATGNYVQITGTTTITAITLATGARRVVKFTGALTLAYNASSLILPGGASITTAAGDTAEFWGISGGAICTQYTPANGQAVSPPSKLATGRTIAMTGDVSWTSPAFDGSGNVTAAGTIQNGAVTGAKTAANTIANANLAQMAANTIKGNNTSATANAADLTQAQAAGFLGSFLPVQGVYATISGGVLATQKTLGGASISRTSQGNYAIGLGSTALNWGMGLITCSRGTLGVNTVGQFDTAGPFSANGSVSAQVFNSAGNAVDPTDLLVLFY